MRPVPTEATQSEDQGCLRQVLAVPLVILYLLAAGFCYYALAIRPSGTWDKDAYAGIVLSCLLTIVVSAVTLLITVVPSVRRVMGHWWMAPPLLLTAVSAVRWISLG
jgi:hypothetical protein